MVQYLKSGESKLGCLNNSVAACALHKDNEMKFEENLTVGLGSGDIGGGELRDVAEGVAGDRDSAVGERRSRNNGRQRVLKTPAPRLSLGGGKHA